MSKKLFPTREEHKDENIICGNIRCFLRHKRGERLAEGDGDYIVSVCPSCGTTGYAQENQKIDEPVLYDIPYKK